VKRVGGQVSAWANDDSLRDMQFRRQGGLLAMMPKGQSCASCTGRPDSGSV